MPATRLDSLDGILDEFYGVISGPAGEEPDWQRERLLYAPQAVFVRATRRTASTPMSGVMDLDGFIASSREYLLENDFYEREVSRKTLCFGSIAQVMSTYESSSHADGREPFARGVNSIQLFHDGKRWWIASVVWDHETDDQPIPEDLAPRRDSSTSGR